MGRIRSSGAADGVLQQLASTAGGMNEKSSFVLPPHSESVRIGLAGSEMGNILNQKNMKNRYGKKLREENRKILEISPASPTLRTIMALEFKKLFRTADRVLEIGCGEGDSAEPVLAYTSANMELLDESPEMVRIAKQRLARYKKRVTFIAEDGLSYLERSKPYDFILSSWTIHNFTWEDKVKLFRMIYRKLRTGGLFIMMDKVYPERDKKKLLDLQLARYRYLSKLGMREIMSHERNDFSSRYRMDEQKTYSVLRRIGFHIRVIDRVERDVIMVAKKEL